MGFGSSISPLRWAGGKSWLAGDIKRLFDATGKECLFEPFVGGGSVFLTVNAKETLISDTNPFLINFWRLLRNQGGWIFANSLPWNDEESYYLAREQLNKYVKHWRTDKDIRCSIHGDKEMGLLFYYLNKTCFNGLWRTNKQGEMNVPYGKRKNVNFDLDCFVSDSVKIRCGSYEKTIQKVIDSGECDKYFIYADPPYVGGFCDYGKSGFSWRDQVKLTKLLVEASQLGASVLISNKLSEETKALYSDNGFTMKYVDAPRRISSDGNRDSVVEMLAGINLEKV